MRQMSKKKVTIEQRILRPYIGFMILLPLVILIFFNVSMKFYIEKSGREEIRNTLITTNMLLKQQLIKKPVDFESEDDRKRFGDQIDFLNEVFKISKMATNTDVFIFSRNGELIFPTHSNRDPELVKAITDLYPIQEIDGIQRVHVNNKIFLVAGATVEIKEPSPTQRQFHAVYVSSLDSANTMMRRINIILVSIIALSILAGSFIVKRIAEGISKPIIEASDYADEISKGKYGGIITNQSTYELHRLTTSLSDMSKKLENQDMTQRNFLQNVSHELRTPLMSIQGYAEGLVNGVFKECESPAQIIADESVRLKELVDELITLSRLESSSSKIIKSDICLKPYLMETIKRAEGLALKEGKEMSYTCDEDLVLNVDEAHLEKIMSNLLSNAIRHAKSKVWVEAERHDEKCTLRIKDDGMGFRAKDIEFLFDRFYKGTGGNHGLGLAIVKTAVSLNDGDIKAYNGEEGAVFELNFKLK